MIAYAVLPRDLFLRRKTFLNSFQCAFYLQSCFRAACHWTGIRNHIVFRSISHVLLLMYITQSLHSCIELSEYMIFTRTWTGLLSWFPGEEKKRYCLHCPC